MKNLSAAFSAFIFFCIIFFLSIAGGTAQQNSAPPNSMVMSKTTLLATIDPAHKSQREEFKIVFSQQGHSVAYRAEKNGKFQAVLNGKGGRLYPLISHLDLSPDGRHIAHDILVDGKRYMVLDGIEGNSHDDVWPPVFSPDGHHLAYTAQTDLEYYIILDDKVSKKSASYSDKIVFSADSSKIAFEKRINTEHKTYLIVSDLNFDKQDIKEIRDDEFVISTDKTRIAAVSLKNGKQMVIEFSFNQPELVKEGPLYDTIDKVAFGSDGRSVTYMATKGKTKYVVLDGLEEKLFEGVELRDPPVVRPDGKGVGVIIVAKDGWFFQEAFLGNFRKTKRYNDAGQLVYSQDGTHYAYCARDDKKIFVVADGKEGPVFDMVINPMFSPDGSRLVYRARKDGKRFVVVADTNGKTIRQHPSYEQVFQPVFTDDGKSVAYGVKDGNKLIWKVEKL